MHLPRIRNDRWAIITAQSTECTCGNLYMLQQYCLSVRPSVCLSHSSFGHRRSNLFGVSAKYYNLGVATILIFLFTLEF